MSDLDEESKGLLSSEAKQRLEKFGPNSLPEKKDPAYIKFLRYFWGPIPWMIEAALILSLVVQDWVDFFIILLLLIVNAVVGFVEEHQADNAIDSLKENLAVKAKVKRDGKWQSINSEQLVPDDLIRLRLGDIIPADAELKGQGTLKIDESALTGESLPVDKEEGDTIYSGSVVKQGEMTAKITATGEKTYFGKTATLIEGANNVSHFQKAVLKIGNYLIVIAIVLVVLILATSIFRGDKFLEILRFSLVLTIAAIPVAMPTVLSVTMAVGAKLLSKKKAIVRKLSSIEELAGIDILCSDKTGTLTKNQLSLGEPFLVEGVSEDEMILYAALASKEEDQDPIDTLILDSLENRDKLKKYTTENFVPFDPSNKKTEATIKDQSDNQFKVSKGAPQVILNLSSLEGEEKEKISKRVDDFASKGYRTLGVAKSDNGENWKFLGFLSIFDPPRDDSKETIETIQNYGVKLKMVTGDQKAIAKETARQLGLKQNILDASSIENDKSHKQGMLEEQIENADGFAEVFPEHKYHIVEVLQKRDHIVGMTGDGVNDAPALKKADCGIAVSGATDAARGASDIVLLSSGISVVMDALKESRKIFQRMTNYTIYRITETIRVLLFMTLSILVFNFYPVTAVMIVLLALLNDGAILSIAYDNAYPSHKPEKWNMHLVFIVSTVLGLVGVVESFGLFYIGTNVYSLPQDFLQTLIYLKLSVAGHLTVFVARTRSFFWTQKPSSKLVSAVVVTQIVATIIAAEGVFMTPIGWTNAILIWGYCFAWFIIEDLMKVFTYKMLEEKSSYNWRKSISIAK